MHGGLDKIFANNKQYTIPDVPTCVEHGRDTCGPRIENPVHGEDMEEEVWNTVSSMIIEAQGNDVLLSHLLVGVLCLKGNESRCGYGVRNSTPSTKHTLLQNSPK